MTQPPLNRPEYHPEYRPEYRPEHCAGRPGSTSSSMPLWWRQLLSVVALLCALPAAAFTAGLNAVQTRYPAAIAVHDCGVCHNSASSPFPRTGSPPRSINAFGAAWMSYLLGQGLVVGQQTLDQGMAALAYIEPLDSDGDGVSNGVELNTGAGFNPGNASNKPPTGPDTQAPAAPSLVTPIDVGTQRVNLRWLSARDNVGVVRYEVYREGPGDAARQLVAQVAAPATSYVDTRVGETERYIYQVRAVDAAGNGTDSLRAPADLKRAPPAVSLAYVPDSGAGTVSVIDVELRSIVATVNVGALPWGVAVAPDARRVFVGNAGSGTVSVIDTDTQVVLATIAVGRGPRGLALTPDGGRLFVACHDDDTLWVVDTQRLDAVGSLPVGVRPYGVAAHPIDGRVYVANSGGASVSVVDAASLTVVQTFTTAELPWALALSPDGERLYVTHFVGAGGGSLSAVHTAAPDSGALSLPGLSQPGGVAVSADGSTVWVTSFEDGTLSAIDAQRLVVSGRQYSGSAAGGISIDPGSDRVLVANYGSNTLTEFQAPLAGGAATPLVAGTGLQPLGLGGFVARVSSVTSLREADTVFRWGEATYPSLLRPSNQVNPATQLHGSYAYRYYPGSQAYAGVRRGRVYYLAPNTGQGIVEVGRLDMLLQAAVDAGY